MTITFWIGYTFLILLQSWSFTFVSRARNSGSLGLHALASIVSSAVWIIAQMFTLSVLAKAITGGLGLGPTIVAIVIYSLASMAGSVFAHWIALRTESGKTAVGSSKKYIQITAEEWRLFQKRLEYLEYYDK